MIYFTSDLHLGHSKIIEYCGRPFKSVEEMDKVLIENWNRIVSPKDTIYCLGDFAFSKNYEKVQGYVKQLHGKKYFSFGNHDDRDWIVRLKKESLIWGCEDSFIVKDNGVIIYGSHYPHRSWPKSFHGSYHVYGHVHGTINDYGRSTDIGVDCWEYSPVSLKTVIERLSKTASPKERNDLSPE